MPNLQSKSQKKAQRPKTRLDEQQPDSAVALPPQTDFLGLAPAKPGGNAQAHATALTRATGNRLARAGQSILQLQRQYGNRYVQRVVDFARKLTPPLQAQANPENKTGLPDNLKTNVENLSGQSLDDVKVHYNSNKPAQVDALAYTQGSEIHVAPGQEAHLPHETWHVVQQKQGRVQPTLQAKGLGINDDPSLENEATVMGAKAMQPSQPVGPSTMSAGESAQRQSGNPVQFLKKYAYDLENAKRKDDEPEVIDLSKASYQELVNYKTMWNEQQLDNKANPQWEFEAGDVDKLNKAIETKEADTDEVSQVICPEGDVKVALPSQSLTFGGVTSCMTISVVLDDNTLISAHNGLMITLPNGGIDKIKQIKNEKFKNKKINKVMAIGAGNLWDARIRGVMDPAHNGSILISVDEQNFTKTRNQKNIASFENYISGRLGNAPTTFTDHDEGKATISKNRQYISA